MRESNKLDKRLIAAKVIGIILFAVAIIGFSSNIIAGIMSVFLFPNLDHFNTNGQYLFKFIYWIFSHYTLMAFSFSLVWIPLFVGARAVHKFKEWGRVLTIIMLFLMMIPIIGIIILFFQISEIPKAFSVLMAISYSFYIATNAVGAYFLMRRSTREGIRDYKRSRNIVAETGPEAVDPLQQTARKQVAKKIVADIVLEPRRRKVPAILIAGIMMTTFPSFWAVISLILTLTLDGFTSIIGFLSLIVSVITILCGVTVIWHKAGSRKWAIGACGGNIILLIMMLNNIPWGALLIFIGYYSAILLLIILNYNKFFENDITEQPPAVDDFTVAIDRENLELKQLNETLTQGTINETDYEQKAVEIKVTCRSQPLVNRLRRQQEKTMMPDDVFKNKCEQIMLEKRMEAENEMQGEKQSRQLRAERLSLIAKEKLEKLSVPNRSKLERYLEIMVPTDIIVYHEQKIKLFHAERWAAINEANTQDHFEVILRL